jgi:hypothetical protein
MTQTTPNPEAEQSFAQAWEELVPGERASKGVYSVYKTHEGELLISYRPDALAEDEPDQTLIIPDKLMKLIALASEGKLSPREMLSALMSLRGMGGMLG